MNLHTESSTVSNDSTLYIPVEPLPPAPAPALSSALPAAPAPAIATALAPATIPATAPEIEAVPEWEQHIAPPAIAQAIPDVVIDARELRAAQYQAPVPTQYVPPQPVAQPVAQHYAPPQNLYEAPAPVPASVPQPVPPTRQQQYATQPNAGPQYASQNGAPFGVAYSPFRDDANSYNLVVEHRGVEYFTSPLSEAAKAYTNSFARRFVADPNHRIVEGGPGIVLPRHIALEEVLGGEIEEHGQKVQVEPGYIYYKFPELAGHLNVRELTLDEATDEKFLINSHFPTYEKYMVEKEKTFDIVIGSVLLGWSIRGVEVNSANISRLSLEVKRVLFTRIGAGNVLGLNEDDWFRSRDSRDSGR